MLGHAAGRLLLDGSHKGRHNSGPRPIYRGLQKSVEFLAIIIRIATKI